MQLETQNTFTTVYRQISAQGFGWAHSEMNHPGVHCMSNSTVYKMKGEQAHILTTCLEAAFQQDKSPGVIGFTLTIVPTPNILLSKSELPVKPGL